MAHHRLTPRMLPLSGLPAAVNALRQALLVCNNTHTPTRAQLWKQLDNHCEDIDSAA